MRYLIVFVGAGIGGALRHGVNVGVSGVLGTGFPYATLAVNVLGSFLMGVIAGFFALRGQAPWHWPLFLTTGVLGGFTTFSAFSLEAVLLVERRELWAAAAYTVTSFVGAVTALFLGLLLVRTITP